MYQFRQESNILKTIKKIEFSERDQIQMVTKVQRISQRKMKKREKDSEVKYTF